MVKWKNVEKSMPNLNGGWKTNQLIFKTNGNEKYLLGYYSVYLGYLTMDHKPARNITHYSELN